MRTHRTLLVLNWIVSYQNHDNYSTVEWAQLRKMLTRSELIQLIRNVKAGQYYLSGMDNAVVSQVVGV